MFKPFTFGFGLAFALAATGVSQAGGFLPSGGCSNCPVVAPAPQGYVAPSPQVITPSAQTLIPEVSPCGNPCAAPVVECAPAPSGCNLGNKLKGCFSGVKLPKISCPKFRLEKYTVTKTKFRLVRDHAPEICAAPVYGAPVYAGPAPVYGSAQEPVFGSAQGVSAPIYGSAQGFAAPADVTGSLQAAPAPLVTPQGQH